MINFIKSKQSWSENRASRQSCGGLGRRNPAEQRRVVHTAVERAGVEGRRRILHAGFSICTAPTAFMAVYILPK